MNVKELIRSQPPECIAAVILKKFQAEQEGRERAKKRLVQFIEDLNQIEPVESGHMILGIFHVDEDGDYLDPCLYRKEDLAAGLPPDSELAKLECIDGLCEAEVERLAHIRDFPESYAFEFSPWNEILGYEIDVRNARDVGVPELCAAIIWDMTFFGFEEEKVEAERRKLDEAARESEEIRKRPEEEQKKYFLSAEDVFAKFGLPERTEEERRESHRRICREVLTNNLRTYRALQKYGCSDPAATLQAHNGEQKN